MVASGQSKTLRVGEMLGGFLGHVNVIIHYIEILA
jgi:hypothetical protein